MEAVEKKLEWFCEIMTCSNNLYLWTFDSEMKLMNSNCPEEQILHSLFLRNNNDNYILKYAKNHEVPLILSDAMGLIWIADFEKLDGVLQKVHVLGPTFAGDISVKSLEGELKKLNLTTTQKSEYIHLLKSLSVTTMTHMCEYGLMLHFCITGNKIIVSDFHFQESDQSLPITRKKIMNRHGTWALEQTVMKMVREGNLNYKTSMSRLYNMGAVGKLSNDDPIRHTKNTIIIFTALCTRAAISGGLSPEIAYTISDRYIQKVEACNTVAEITEVSNTMQEDFIQRVHRCKSNSSITQPIRECCDYIALHVEDNLNIQDIASQVGYTEYYLTKKFKKEMKCSISNYMKHAKIEHAKVLLISTKQSIQDISDLLGFCSQSYFAETFRKIVGTTPGDYRAHPTD